MTRDEFDAKLAEALDHLARLRGWLIHDENRRRHRERVWGKLRRRQARKRNRRRS